MTISTDVIEGLDEQRRQVVTEIRALQRLLNEDEMTLPSRKILARILAIELRALDMVVGEMVVALRVQSGADGMDVGSIDLAELVLEVTRGGEYSLLGHTLKPGIRVLGRHVVVRQLVASLFAIASVISDESQIEIAATFADGEVQFHLRVPLPDRTLLTNSWNARLELLKAFSAAETGTLSVDAAPHEYSFYLTLPASA